MSSLSACSRVGISSLPPTTDDITSIVISTWMGSSRGTHQLLWVTVAIIRERGGQPRGGTQYRRAPQQVSVVTNRRERGAPKVANLLHPFSFGGGVISGQSVHGRCCTIFILSFLHSFSFPSNTVCTILPSRPNGQGIVSLTKAAAGFRGAIIAGHGRRPGTRAAGGQETEVPLPHARLHFASVAHTHYCRHSKAAIFQTSSSVP